MRTVWIMFRFTSGRHVHQKTANAVCWLRDLENSGGEFSPFNRCGKMSQFWKSVVCPSTFFVFVVEAVEVDRVAGFGNCAIDLPMCALLCVP